MNPGVNHSGMNHSGANPGMKMAAALLATVIFAGPSIPYFKYQRPIQAQPGGQQFVVVDEQIWKNARPDLGDLRLYSGQQEVPYALMVERGSRENDNKDVRVLQQSVVGGKTQFMIDMAGVAEYDHIDLKLAAKNFVAHARVEGQEDMHGVQWALLAESILYDLSKENLGGNSMLRLPLSTYKYLRVTIDGPVKPQDVLGASSEFRQEQKAVWRDVGGAPTVTEMPARASRDGSSRVERKGTMLTFAVPENVPVNRVSFDIDPAQPNFRREIHVTDDKDVYIGSGEIDRVHMVRQGQKIDSDSYDVSFSAIGHKTIKVIIDNGDDPPLKIKSARLQQLEHRLYFDAPASGPLTLYYGDEKLDPPVYDYGKLFLLAKDAGPAQLGAEESNAAYTGRPDERPWTEKHPAVLWIAIVAAVLILGAIALRSMKTAVAA
ncbi:MAG TPA: DUF3999 family protein [Candidatus Polarisedimenticolia bacterium]|jgi:hypothetical protein|nr:DUF3999 family protein [Candidatus Polarisedimenticolia bacterium]